jgi:hypothetical protein
MRRLGYQNAILTAIAVLLGLNLLSAPGGVTEPAPAAAQFQQPQADQGGLVSAGEQRKVMINQLRSIESRLERIEAKVAGGLSVKVTDMPPFKLPPELMKRLSDAQPAGADATK